MIMKYFRCDQGIFTPTDERPTASEHSKLIEELERHHSGGIVHKHSPGDGWHFVLGEEVIAYNGQFWFATRPDSTQAILAHVIDICREAGLDSVSLWMELSSEIGLPMVKDEDRRHCTRPAALEDLLAVLSDLESINYHQLHAALKRALGSKASAAKELE